MTDIHQKKIFYSFCSLRAALEATKTMLKTPKISPQVIIIGQEK
tara:strand:+ start:345 stop:476 length:132 start_codon:yes stop_codon:yes gene_type:complete